MVPEGNYIIIKGNEADANADFLRDGYEEVIGDAVAAGDITIVGRDVHGQLGPVHCPDSGPNSSSPPTTTWQAVLSENDGMAGGVVATLEAQGLAGHGAGVRSGR